MSLIESVQLWRKKQGYEGKGGVVVVFDNVVQGWVKKLRNPDHWQPGCIAVDESGNTWIAVGGDEPNGATLWMPGDSATWTGTR